MNPAITPAVSTLPPDPTLELINQAKVTVEAVLDLEQSTGWQWHLRRVTRDLGALSKTILTDLSVREDALTDARAAFAHHQKQFEAMYRDFQIALQTLHQHGQLPAGLLARLTAAPPAAPHPVDMETFNPFGSR